MNEQLVQEHNRLFKQALSIVEGKLSSQGQPDMPVPGWLLSRNFKHAIALFERVLEINPGNWSAMWFMGKVHQRLRNNAEAFSWFERAYHVNPSHPDIAREASISAMEIGSHDSAIVFANRATQIGPTNPGLSANLALAYLLAGRVADAETAINCALATDSPDTISQTVRAMIQHFAGNGRVPPTTTSALLDYWVKNRRGG